MFVCDDKPFKRGIMLFFNRKLGTRHYTHVPPFCKGGKGDFMFMGKKGLLRKGLCLSVMISPSTSRSLQRNRGLPIRIPASFGGGCFALSNRSLIHLWTRRLGSGSKPDKPWRACFSIIVFPSVCDPEAITGYISTKKPAFILVHL